MNLHDKLSSRNIQITLQSLVKKLGQEGGVCSSCNADVDIILHVVLPTEEVSYFCKPCYGETQSQADTIAFFVEVPKADIK